MKILLISSTGGHFQALLKLHHFWRKHDCCWVTFQTSSTELILNEEKVYWAYSPTNRNLPNLIRNCGLAWQVIRQECPQLILSTGAGVAVPFIILGKLAGIKTAFIESFTRVQELSLSAKLVLPFLDVVYVSWAQVAAKYSKAQLIRM
ncbi:MAG: PssD/Cps14F family polysaccharide biosynthesis glycosyltransferase [Xenococcaceae cyanobacterium MO_207.B15]|nr:PssD/Cps14F family polysaccharide biosynthesis glycosyltransferase [Xenococcaceae cyanobacterium MO_207.B15]